MDYFSDLGARVGRRWRGAHYNDTEFSRIAQEELESTPGYKAIQADDVLDWVNQPFFDLPYQEDIRAEFGDPPITVYQSPRFCIDVNFWLDSTTLIHEHGFDGAFQVLSGSSLHSTYSFREHERYNSSIGRGELSALHSELLAPGCTRAIQAGSAFSHALFHLERPSSTIVVRTKSNRSASAQNEFFRPGLRVDSFHVDQNVKRNVQVAALLIQSRNPRFEAWLSRFLDHTDAYGAVRMLQSVNRLLRGRDDLEHEGIDAFLSSQFDALERRAPWGSFLRQVLKHGEYERVLMRARAIVHDPGERFFLALLLNVQSAPTLLSLIEQRYPGVEPASKVSEWLARLCSSGTRAGAPLELELNEASQLTLRRLLEGRSVEAISAEMTERYGRPLSPAKIQSLVNQLRSSCLAPLVSSQALSA